MTSDTQVQSIIVNQNGMQDEIDMLNSNENDEKIKNNITENIYQLFSSSLQIRIPPYQRAYSWEEKHCSQFFEDILEQKGKKYYLGQLLFEKAR